MESISNPTIPSLETYVDLLPNQPGYVLSLPITKVKLLLNKATHRGLFNLFKILLTHLAMISKGDIDQGLLITAMSYGQFDFVHQVLTDGEIIKHFQLNHEIDSEFDLLCFAKLFKQDKIKQAIIQEFKKMAEEARELGKERNVGFVVDASPFQIRNLAHSLFAKALEQENIALLRTLYASTNMGILAGGTTLSSFHRHEKISPFKLLLMQGRTEFLLEILKDNVLQQAPGLKSTDSAGFNLYDYAMAYDKQDIANAVKDLYADSVEQQVQENYHKILNAVTLYAIQNEDVAVFENILFYPHCEDLTSSDKLETKNEYKTPLMMALIKGKIHLVLSVLKNKSLRERFDLMATDFYNRNILHYVFYADNVPVLECLVPDYIELDKQFSSDLKRPSHCLKLGGLCDAWFMKSRNSPKLSPVGSRTSSPVSRASDSPPASPLLFINSKSNQEAHIEVDLDDPKANLRRLLNKKARSLTDLVNTNQIPADALDDNEKRLVKTLTSERIKTKGKRPNK